MGTHKYVCAVDKVIKPLLRDQQHLVKQEEGSLFFHPLNPEGTFQNQLSKATQVGSSPVHQQALDLLEHQQGL